MPILPSTYRPSLLMRSGHLNTVQAGQFRRVPDPGYVRQRIETPDGDFVDLDRVRRGFSRVVVLLHGLEGGADRAYIRGMARAALRGDWDVVAMNFRGCSGEPNRLLRSYHSGETGDLQMVLSHVLPEYDSAALMGFSLGGNVTLKYVGECGGDLDPRITRAVAFSVPCDLKSGAEYLARRAARPYMRRFLISLREKTRQKMRQFPGEIDDDGIERIRTFRDFDERYTAPIHGFKDAEDYWALSSSRQFLRDIRVPTLIVSALDDPFLAPESYPEEEARASKHVHLEMPRYGGHVGFVRGGREYWSEERAVAFLNSDLATVR